MQDFSVAPVRVVIVNYNGGAWLGRAVAGLLAQSYREFEAVVVDNASSDGSLANLPQDHRLRVLRLKTNVGFAAANNRGASGFTGRWLATLNPDAVPAPDWLQQLLDAAAGHPDAAFFGSTQLSMRHAGSYDGTGDGLTVWGYSWRGDIGRPVRDPHPDGDVFAPCAAAALYDRDWFERLGGFDERLFCYLEDVDLALRLRLAGGRCHQVGAAIVHHAGSALTGSDFTLQQVYRNQLWLLARYWPVSLLTVVLPGHIFLLLLLAPHFLRRGKLLAVGQGLMAGLRGLPEVWRERSPASPVVLARTLPWNPWLLLQRTSPVRASAGGSGWRSQKSSS